MKPIPRLGRTFTTCYSQGEIQLVEVQVLIRKGLPKIDIIGLPQNMIREGKDRILSALSLMGIDPPAQKILVSLNPGDLPKEGSHFDLPILLAVLKAMGIMDPEKDRDFAWGELSLNGSIRPVQNILAHILYANAFRAGKLYANAHDETASFIKGFIGRTHSKIEYAYDLVQPQNLETNETSGTETADSTSKILETWVHCANDQSIWNTLRGSPNQFLLWCLVNSGRHHILLEGSPGVGKSAWCTAIKDIQSPLLSDEIIEKFKISPHETSKLRSLEDLLQAPYEAPHHSSSMASIVGGGSQSIHIGSITRAHRGILFLDELAEFPKNVIEALREPLESKSITLGRSGCSKSFPADIQLIAAMNPCPCGNHLSKKQCYCGTKKFYDYQSKVSTPMRERFHLSLYWSYENFAQPPEFQLKKIRQKIIDLRTVPIPQMSGIKIPHDLNPRRQRKWAELFRTWCHWHAISTPSPTNQHDFQEFISELQNQNTKEPYEQFRYN